MRREQGLGIGAFLAGIGVGTAITLLIAPWSGEETRGPIAARVRQGKDYAARKGSKIADQAADSLRGTKAGLQDAIEAGKDVYKEEIRRI